MQVTVRKLRFNIIQEEEVREVGDIDTPIDLLDDILDWLGEDTNNEIELSREEDE